MKLYLLSLSLLAMALPAAAQRDTLSIASAAYSGPVPVVKPYGVDSVSSDGTSFSLKQLLSGNAALQMARLKPSDAQRLTKGSAVDTKKAAFHTFAFTLQSDRFVKGALSVKNFKQYKLFVEGEGQSGNELTLLPRRYNLCLVCLADTAERDTFDVSFNYPHGALVTANSTSCRPYTVPDQVTGVTYSGVAVSPSGKYLLTGYRETDAKGNARYFNTLTETQTGKLIRRGEGGIGQWMPLTDRIYRTEKRGNMRPLLSVDPATGVETVLAENVPDGWFTLSPTQDYLVYSIADKDDQADNGGLRQLYSPDDRMPGWSSRSSLYRYDLKTGLMQQLTFGHTKVSIEDISNDGRRMLFTTASESWANRPFYRSSLFCMDMQTLKVDTLLLNDGTLAGCQFSPDGSQLLIKAWGDAFGGIGRRILPGQKASMYDYQLYLYNPNTKKAQPLTADFNPSVSRVAWNRHDGQIYFTADDRDYVHLYTLNPATGKIRQLPTNLDVLQGFSLANNASVAAFYGQTGTTARTLYTLQIGKKPVRGGELNFEKTYADVAISPCTDYRFRTQRGDSIDGRFYLPYNFDPAKKYPMIVYYYGGCTPTQRVLEFQYPYQVLAGQGYVVYVIQPSGTIGYGQEFSARHVNAWGKRTAEDIIEGTRAFCASHTYVDSTKIGCMGASYGGFMTEYLVTQTHLFATAISHAGISNIASYWGGGNWGYSYGEMAATGSYPWNNPDLYVGQSPLFHAENIHTPLLLIHGTADTNVPTNESQQLFTALKILGREVAYVQVDGQNHVITDFAKRARWQKTIFAWFARQLKGEPEWWNELYPRKQY